MVPADVGIAPVCGRERWIVPASNRAAAGLLFKQQSATADRSALVRQVMPGEETCEQGIGFAGAIGQTDFAANGENECPESVLRRNRLASADSGNNRAMIRSL